MNWYKKAQEKKMILMRGISGSGKSTLAKEIGQGGVVLSTDDFFNVGGEYKYDPDMIGQAHTWNQGRANQALQKGVSPIVIDNTNVQAWEMRPYVEKALQYGYKIEFAEPNTPWKFDAEELAKKNSHGVPQDVIEKMINNWDHNVSVEEVLNAEKPEKQTEVFNLKINKIAQENKDKEYPIAAAVVASGKVFTGRHHGEAIQKAIDEGFAIRNKDGYLEDKDGNDMVFSGAIDLFLTNKGRLIDRFESYALGQAVGAENIPEKNRL